MSVEQDFLIVGGSSIANVDSQATYAGSGYQENGNPAGLLRSAAINKQMRQGTTGMALLASFIVQELNEAVIDNGQAGLATLLSQFTAALQVLIDATTAPSIIHVTYSATPVFPCGPAQISVFELILGGNVTSSTFSGLVAGQILILNIVQSGAGNDTFVAPPGFPMPPINAPSGEASTMSAVYLGGGIFAPLGAMTGTPGV